MLDVALLGLAALTAWVLVLLVSPIRKRCSWCKGTRRAKKHRWWGRVGACRKCQARGKHMRFGAPVVHKARQMILDELRERRANR